MGTTATAGILFLISTFTFLTIGQTSDVVSGEVLSFHTSVSSPTATYSPTPSPTLTPTPTIVPSVTPSPTLTPTPAPPTHTPMPTTLPHSGEQLENWFNTYSQMFNIDREILKKIAWCESHYNSGAANGPYGGMFQFTEGAWKGARNRMGHDENSDLRFHAEESIKTAAFKISKDGTQAWLNCSK